jgi:hypothetical protein
MACCCPRGAGGAGARLPQPAWLDPAALARAAPIQRAILAGDEQTGVDIMQMEAGLDTGPVRASVAPPSRARRRA